MIPDASPRLVGGVVVLMLIIFRWFATPRRRLPPGPWSLPIIGSIHHMSFLKGPEYTFWQWREQFGDVVYFKLFQTPAIVLNSLAVARNLLDKRSANYSDRPRMVLMSEMIGYENCVPMMRYGERFRRQRKWIHDAMGVRSKLAGYQPIMRRGANVLLQDLLDSPEVFADHLHKYVAGSIQEITYGRRLISMEDELVVFAERANTSTNDRGHPGSLLVDFFPMLKYIPTWMPGAGFKRRAMRARDDLVMWQNIAVDRVKEDMALGTGSPCVTSALLDAYSRKENRTAEKLEDIRGTGVSIYGGEQTHTTLLSFFLVMTRTPRVLRAAQDEVDHVVGRDRLPTFSDRDSLPYLNALLEEMLRWRPGLSLALPHSIINDDNYRGYDIPGGCMVLPNIWGMSRDTEFWPEPEEFRPERHLVGLKEKSAHGELPSGFVFGFGRRVCPGQAFADRALWLAVSNIIAAFDILPPLNEAGEEVVPPANFKPGLTRRVPFKCRVIPRSEKLAEMVMQSMQSDS
ncbi:cytochrome P450 [Epithele typhae]|uniref:cytochrome P450 n=1 Tax=Epithele typhae TaxID=378194 RepID=UPI0020077B71|nr:cytochrome P450 [Epithele typhae]KAH9916572.1 cytochrome P450 [Epithele typhae]